MVCSSLPVRLRAAPGLVAVATLHIDFCSLAPNDGTPGKYLGVVDQLEGINEAILRYLQREPHG